MKRIFTEISTQDSQVVNTKKLKRTCLELNKIETQRRKFNDKLDTLNPENIDAFISRLNQIKIYLGDEEEKKLAEKVEDYAQTDTTLQWFDRLDTLNEMKQLEKLLDETVGGVESRYDQLDTKALINEKSYEILIAAIKRAGDDQEAWKLFEEMINKELTPTDDTYASLMIICNGYSCFEAVDHMYGQLQTKDNPLALAIMIKRFLIEGNTTKIDELHQIVKEKDDKTKREVVNFLNRWGLKKQAKQVSDTIEDMSDDEVSLTHVEVSDMVLPNIISRLKEFYTNFENQLDDDEKQTIKELISSYSEETKLAYTSKLNVWLKNVWQKDYKKAYEVNPNLPDELQLVAAYLNVFS